jgi:hypothetical protein
MKAARANDKPSGHPESSGADEALRSQTVELFRAGWTRSAIAKHFKAAVAPCSSTVLSFPAVSAFLVPLLGKGIP